MPHKLLTSINTPLHSQGVPLECASRISLHIFYPVYLQISWDGDLSGQVFVGTVAAKALFFPAEKSEIF